MNIQIKTKEGKIIPLHVNPTELISDLKLKIQIKECIPIDQQEIIFNGQKCSDNFSLNDYNIQEDTNLLLVNKEKSLLFKSSIIFDGSNLIDRMRQSSIDINLNSQEEDVLNLLNEALSYLEDNLDANTAKELFSLIICCFSYFPDQCLKFLDKCLQKESISVYHFLITATIISNLAIHYPKIQINEYDDFVSSSLQQINRSIDGNINVFGQQIPQQFKKSFIIDIVLLSAPTEKNVPKFYPYIICHGIDINVLNYYVRKVSESGLLNLIPESEFIKNQYFLNLSLENVRNFISISTEQTFRKILPQIEDPIIKTWQITPSFCNTLIKKLIECDIYNKSIRMLFNQIESFEINSKAYNYLIKYDIQLPEKITSKMETIPNFPYIMKLFIHQEKLPEEYLTLALGEANELDFYEKVNPSIEINLSIFSTLKFWKHILSLVSSSEKPCSIGLINKFAHYFEKNIKLEDFPNIYDSLIFDEFPPDEKQSIFLIKLIKSMDKKYYEELLSYKRCLERNPRLIKQKNIPYPSLCKLFDLSSYYFDKNITPLTMYEYEFSQYRSYHQINFSLEITLINDEPNDVLLQFIIQNNNFSLIRNIDEKTLSLIACALLYTSEKNHKDIKGLTKENILPFYAISFNYLEKCEGNLKKSSKEMLDLLVESCRHLDNCHSSLLNESINAILSNQKFLFDSNIFPSETAFQIFEILCDLLVNDKYCADKSLLILVLFQLSCRNKTPIIVEQVSLIVKKYGIRLFDIILKNKNQIINDERFNDYSFNLDLFDSIELQNLILNRFQNLESDIEIIQFISIITKCFTNTPILKIDNTTVIYQTYQKLIDEERWNDYLLIVQFMKKNNININYKLLKGNKIPFNISKVLIDFDSSYCNLDNLIEHILNFPQIEQHLSLFERLFKLLMKEQSIAYKHILASIEKLASCDTYSSDMEFKPKLIIAEKNYLFHEYKNDLLFVLKHAYVYSSDSKRFIRKVEIETLNFPDIDYSFLEVLINDQSYQSFVCLHYIASYFPFIFEPDLSSNTDNSDYLLAVDLVLPTLNCLSTIYDDDDEISDEKINNFKKAIAALSFLFSCLNSTKFISVFIQWIFDNIESLNDSQVICISAILCSIYSITDIGVIVVGYACKYNFLDKIVNLLSREIHDEKFAQFYKRNIYRLLEYYVKTVSTIVEYKNILLIDQIKNGTITNPFDIIFNNFLIIPSRVKQPLQIIFPIENNITKIITDFLSTINTKQQYWISYMNSDFYYTQYAESNVTELISFFTKEKYVFIDEKLPYCPYTKTIRMMRYINTQPMWIYDYIGIYRRFRKLHEHHSILCQTIAKINEIEQNSRTNPNSEDVDCPKEIKPFDYLKDQLHHEKLFRKMIEDLEYVGENTKNYIFNLINEYVKKTENMNTFLHIITESFDKIKSEYPYRNGPFLSRLAQVILNCWQYNYDFDEYFFKICGNQFIDMTLYLCERANGINLSNAAYILNSLDCEIPISASHIVGFIFKYHPDVIPRGIVLFTKLNKEKSVNVLPIIKRSYEREIKSENHNYVNFKYYLAKLPNLAKNDIPFLYNFLTECITKYKERKNDDLLDLICELFNCLAPERDQYQLIYSPKSTEIDFSRTLSDKKCKPKLVQETKNQNTLLEPAPQSLLQSTSSKFWIKLYEKYRQFLSELIEKDDLIFEKLTFLHDYHELVPFRIRSSYFKKFLKTLENNRNKIKIKVSRSNILNDTFNALVNKKPKELLGNLIVQFNDEKGIDAGGLTNEWFTYIIKELFNPDFGLFLKSENNCYHPNSLSYINSNHIQYFKLAGEILALALVKGICVDAHLSMAFYRQILHQKIKLKDLEDFDESLFKSLQMILDIDDVKDLDLVFSIDDDQFGKITTIQLMENGEKIAVTNENRMEYVSLYANYKLRKATIKQISAFCDAFDEIISPKFIRIFSPSELDLMICGIPKIDVNDMKMFTYYVEPYHKDHQTIVMFFNMLSKWDQENLAKFLQFLTGSSQVSVNGFKDFVDRGKPITIAPGGEKNRLPVAHTCFKMLDLPEYDNENDMKEKLMFAIQDCEFGLI